MKIKLSDITIDYDIQLKSRGIDDDIVGGYVEAMTNGDNFPPVIIFQENGYNWLADGFHRINAAKFLGFAEIEADIKPGSKNDAAIYAAEANVINGRPMSQEEKKEAGLRLLELLRPKNYSEVARRLKVTREAVRQWDYVKESANVNNLTIEKKHTSNNEEVLTDTELDTLAKAGITQCPTCGNLYDQKKFYSRCPYCYKAMNNLSGWVEGLPEMVNNKPHISFNAGDNEWYTPQEYIDSAISVMGQIDLDPASTETANSVVKAANFYTTEDSGLNYQWAGKVWMNPPYARDLIGDFIQKLITHFQASEVTEAIVLVNNATETKWFQDISKVASALCLPQGRIRFWHTQRKEATPLQGQAVLYLGGKPKIFRQEFSQYGVVWCK